MEFINSTDNNQIDTIGELSQINVDNSIHIENNQEQHIELYDNPVSRECISHSMMSQVCNNDFITEIRNNKNKHASTRFEYLNIMNGNEPLEVIKNIYDDSIKEVILQSEKCENSNDFHITVEDIDQNNKQYFQLSEGKFIIVGRMIGCDFISKNSNVSRVNTVILKFMNKIYIYDFYSLNRTIVKQRGINKQVDTCEDQSVMKFNEHESGKLEIGNGQTQIMFTEKECITCCERARSIVFEPCKHCIMCEECINNYNDIKCPICKTIFTNIIKDYLCIQTKCY